MDEDKEESIYWREKYAELIEILRTKLKIDVLDGTVTDDSDEEEKDEKQVLHILREIKELQSISLNARSDEIKNIIKEQKIKRDKELKVLFSQIELMEKTIKNLEKKTT